MSKNWGRSGVRQSSGVNILKKKNLRSINTSLVRVETDFAFILGEITWVLCLKRDFFKTLAPLLCLIPLLPKFLLISLSVPPSKNRQKNTKPF